MQRLWLLVAGCALLGLVLGCSGSDSGTTTTSGTTGSSTSGNGTGGSGGSSSRPAFSLAWSEYPSWSVFGVAHELKIINGKEGEFGEIEEKYGVDIVLKEADYVTCMNMFTNKDCDAVCITNMDALIASPSRDGVAVLPTSTSNGADACIVVGIDDIDGLKAHKVYGLEKSVSEYCFNRCLEKSGYNPAEFQFVNKDPAAAATAMQTKDPDHQAIMVWNPFVLQTLKDRPDAKVLFDSSRIPGEIVDMVVVGKDVLDKPGGKDFSRAVIATYYRMNKELADPAKSDQLLVALGAKFSRLGLDEMKKAVVQTQFYKTPEEAIAVYEGDEFRQVMKTIEKFCADEELVKDPKYGFGTDDDAPGVALRFDTSFIHEVQGKP
jgi:NitT/TauT family transport system substrate-binding protein